jgi:ATP-binding cassette subfamily B (MDR/TAP) protein 6
LRFFSRRTLTLFLSLSLSLSLFLCFEKNKNETKNSYVCSVGVANGTLRVGDAVLFLSLMAQLAIPLNWFGTFYRTVMQQMLDADGLFSLLAQVPTVVDAPDAVDLPPGGDGSLEFKNVTFSWDRVVPRAVNPASSAAPSSSLSSPVLKNVSLRAPGGTSLAIVGPTGSGKSTLLRLAFRFVDPDSGAVLVEGRDARSLRQRSLRSIMSVTPQDSVLFNDTIEYNLRYANPGATFEEVQAAARVAAIHESILSFPKGYQTVVGERGLRLSGGEKQRVALARAVLRRARIMLLDESTSALDALTEAAVQRALRGAFSSAAAESSESGGGGGGESGGGNGADGGGQEKRTRQKPPTMLIVAHRLSTVMHCDSIAVMKEGRVVEVGKHSELVSLGGLYASMWARQSSSSAALVEEEEGEGEGDKKKDT